MSCQSNILYQKDSILNAIRLLILMIRFALVWSRLCPYYTRRGHGCNRTTQRFIWVSLDGNYVRNRCHLLQYILKNNYQDNKEPLCPYHKNIRLQISPTNAVTWSSSLDPDTQGVLGCGPLDWAWVNILEFYSTCTAVFPSMHLRDISYV